MTGREALERLNACATAEDVVNLAGEAGVALDADKAQALLDKKGALADAQLEGVAGGFLGGGAPMSLSTGDASAQFLSTGDASAQFLSALDGSAADFFNAVPQFL